MTHTPRRIVIPGGSGQIGTLVARALHARGDDVTVLSRVPFASPWRVRWWDGRTLGDWAEDVDGADVVVNLAGRSVNCRYTRANMRQMMDSRVDSTRVLGEAIARAARPPRVWLQASTATIYSHRFDAPNDDVTGVMGGDEPDAPAYWAYSIEIARAWEAELVRAATPRTRKVALRSAMTMSPDAGGIFATLLGLVRRGLGGPAGDGRQWVSWVHEHDFVRALDFMIARDDLDGAVNVCSPNPVPNEAFMRTLRDAWCDVAGRGAVGARLAPPSPAWLLELGAVFLRTDTELILKSRRVVPTRLARAGFGFEMADWTEAARELCERVAGARGLGVRGAVPATGPAPLADRHAM